MKTLVLVLAAAAMTLPLATPVSAKNDKNHGGPKGNNGHKGKGDTVTIRVDNRSPTTVIRVANNGDWRDNDGRWHRYGEWQDHNGKWHSNNGRWTRNTNVATWVRYDYNRPDVDGWYYADRYYRPTVAYRPIVVTRQTRIYRGSDNRYYCRRSDGTTGLIVGAALGGVIGNRLDRGRSSLLGTVLGVGAGAVIGQAIDKGSVTCR